MALGNIFKDFIGWVDGHGNEPGTPNTRKLGYEPADVANSVVADLTGVGTVQPPLPITPSAKGQAWLAGIAGVGILLLLHSNKRKG